MADLFSSAKRQPKPDGKSEASDADKALRRQAGAPRPETASRAGAYTAHDIEVLEGLEPVRRRPGMYIGGTDSRALHHLAAEVLDNAMDEAVAGHARTIELKLNADGSVTVADDGRGIPVDPHPKFKAKSALEVIVTMLHSGGKFSGKVYETSGGLHGVGISVVNALSDVMAVEVARDGSLWRQDYARGIATTKLRRIGDAKGRRGTTVTFHPDAEIFGEELRFKPDVLCRLARSKAYLFRGVTIRWSCPPDMLLPESETPAETVFHFPNGLLDFLTGALGERPIVSGKAFSGSVDLKEKGRAEWAVAWPEDEDGFVNTYCNTIPTPQGGTHEAGLRAALTRSLRAYAELAGNKKGATIQPEDVMGGVAAMLSIFIREPQFQGQTKEKLASAEAQRLVEGAVKDRFDHFLSGDPQAANALLDRIVATAEDRLRRKQDKEILRQTATRRLRLPGKLTDCSRAGADGSELFLVEGDSAGGSAKQARARETQAILPLRGKILNVASASSDKQAGNKELADLALALGCGTGKRFDLAQLRYERVIIMTDADVDGAHIAALLMTFFFREMRPLVETGHLFLAMPPLFRLSQGAKSVYARDDAHKDALLASEFKGKSNVEISRFKGLGEMTPAQLKETTMDPKKRSLIKVALPPGFDEPGAFDQTERLVEDLMGRKPERRFAYIQENARFAVENLDV